MTTGEMAKALGISETHVRWLEKKGAQRQVHPGLGDSYTSRSGKLQWIP